MNFKHYKKATLSTVSEGKIYHCGIIFIEFKDYTILIRVYRRHVHSVSRWTSDCRKSQRSSVSRLYMVANAHEPRARIYNRRFSATHISETFGINGRALVPPSTRGPCPIAWTRHNDSTCCTTSYFPNRNTCGHKAQAVDLRVIFLLNRDSA